MAIERFQLSGSERETRADALAAGRADPFEVIEVSVLMRRRTSLDLSAHPEPIGREEFESRYGGDPADVERLEAFAQTFDLTIVDVSLPRRTVLLSGTVASMNEAFGTRLEVYHCAEGTFRGRRGPLYLPADLESAVVGVFGLDNRPQAQMRCRRHLPIAGAADAARHTSFTPPQVAALYHFPNGVTGAGQTIGIIELGGGYRTADLKTYFTGLGVMLPSITAVSVDRARNAPIGDPGSADGEVLLDIEVAGSIAPGARIAVYFAPNTDQGFLDAITTAVHDTVRKPTAISISWGGPESTWTGQALTAMDQAFQDAAALGVTVCCSSGDNGSSDGVSDGRAHVDFPASSPHVLACGGTHVVDTNGTLSSETVWNGGASGGATGGGVSDVFALPPFQQSAHVPVSVNPSHFKGRGVPDVAGNADPASGFKVHVDGQDVVFGGTSAVSPLWAALVALLNQRRGAPLGYLNPVIYPVGTNVCRDVTSGNNGAYVASAGWDPCTGLGSPNGSGLIISLGSKKAAAAHTE
jgi:kumamolisin